MGKAARGLLEEARDYDISMRGVLRVYAFFFRYIRPYWKEFLLGIVLMLIQIPAGQLSLFLVRDLADQAYLATDKTLDERLATMFGIMAVQAGFWLFGELMWKARELLGWYTMMKATFDLRLAFYKHLHQLPLSFLRLRPPGEHLYRATSDIMSNHNKHDDPGLMGMIRWTVQPIAEAIYSLGWAAAFLWLVDPFLSFAILLYFIPFALTAQAMVGVQRRGALAEGYGNAFETAVLRDTIGGMRTTRSMGRNFFQRAKYSKAWGSAMRASFHYRYAQIATNDLALVLVRGIFTCVVYGFISMRVLQGEATIGDWLATFALIETARGPLESLVMVFQSIRIWTCNGQRVIQTLEQPITLADPERPTRLGDVRGEIELQDVSLTYDEGATALRAVNLKIRPGERVGLVGPSGAGKTSVLNLVLRLYAPSSGRVLVDGHDVGQLKLESFLERVAVVPQATFLYDGTIRDNLAFSRPRATDQEMWQALEAAGVAETLRATGQGLDYEVGDALTLSGGERQRLGIARALLRDPRVLILDEATASLDSATENAILKTLDAASRGRTTLIVAHRLKAVAGCDRILVFEGGQVVAEGTHEQLLTTNPWYAAMWAEQQGEVAA